MIEYMEWFSFGLGAATVWRYGHSLRQGSVLGMACAVSFIAWGFMAGVYAAPLVNVGFFVLHANNFRKSIS